MYYLNVFYCTYKKQNVRGIRVSGCLIILFLTGLFFFGLPVAGLCQDSTIVSKSATQEDTSGAMSNKPPTSVDSTQQVNRFASIFKPFKTFSKNTSIESVTNLTVQQQNISYKTKADFTTQYMLNRHTGSQYQFDVSVTKLNTRVETMGLQLQYNSQDSVQQDTTSGFAKPLFDIVGKTITLNVDSTGRILSMDTSDTGNKISNVLSGLSIAGEDFQAGNNFGLLFDKNTDSLQNGFSWTDSTQTAGRKRITIYTVQSRLHNDIILLIGGSTQQSGTVWSGGRSFKADFTGSQSGKIIISAATQLIKQRNITYTLHESTV